MICEVCGISTASFGLTFFGKICSACVSHEERQDQGAVAQNEEYLTSFFSSRGRQGNTYDCIVPVRPDAEDYFTVEYLVKRGLNPLVVLVNNYFLSDIAWHNFHNMITVYDVDSVTFNPNFSAYKELVRSSLRKLESIYYPYKAILHSYVMRLAREKNISRVVWGQCQPLEFSGKFSIRDKLKLSKWWVLEHELGGVSENRFVGTGVHLPREQLDLLTYPPVSKVKGIQSIFLSNFLVWDQVEQNALAVTKGYTAEVAKNTYDPYENTGSSVYYQLHDLLRLQNTRVPKVHEHLARDIRFGRVIKPENEDKLNDLTPFLAYDIESFFRDFLDTTKSGFDWFVKNRLGSVKHLIRATADRKIVEEFEFNSSLFTNCDRAESKISFVKFAKGI